MLQLNSVSKLISYLKDSSDDSTDRMHYVFTSTFLLFLAGLIGSSQTFGSPIHCMVPANFPSGWGSYINSYCFISKTFVSKNGSDVMPEVMHDYDNLIDISYYQWIPYILLIQAVLFIVPHFYWNAAQQLSDVDFNFFVQQCVKIRGASEESAQKIIKQVAKDIGWIARYRLYRGNMGLGYIGAVVYCSSKLMNVLNLFIQLVFLNFFIGHNRADWGLELINIIMDPTIHTSSQLANLFFPRISFCHVKRHSFGNMQENTVQCLLMINMLNEKLFALIYIWFYVLLAITIANLIYTMLRLVSSVGISQSYTYLKAYDVSEHSALKFCNEKLGLDGILLLHFIKNHAGFFIASKVAKEIYENESKNPNGNGVHGNKIGISASKTSSFEYSDA